MQLTKLRLFYCQVGGSSKAVRQYLESGRIVEWAEKNPEVRVEVKVRNGHHPYIQGRYRTAKNPKQICVKNETPRKIEQVMDTLRNTSGRKVKKLSKPVVTDTPSVQGIWTPMLNLRETPFSVQIVESTEN